MGPLELMGAIAGVFGLEHFSIAGDIYCSKAAFKCRKLRADEIPQVVKSGRRGRPQAPPLLTNLALLRAWVMATLPEHRNTKSSELYRRAIGDINSLSPGGTLINIEYRHLENCSSEKRELRKRLGLSREYFDRG